MVKGGVVAFGMSLLIDQTREGSGKGEYLLRTSAKFFFAKNETLRTLCALIY